MEQLRRITGNGQVYEIDLPLIVIHGKFNTTALKHIENSTGLKFEPKFSQMAAQPTSSGQIVSLLLCYDFKSRYHNSLSFKNELHLKSDHNVGFDVDSVCFDCLEHNRINTKGLESADRLKC